MKQTVLFLFCLIFCMSFLMPAASFATDKESDQVVRGKVEKNKRFSIYTDEQLDEALKISDNCKAYDFTAIHYDCDCMGMTFLELRRTGGDGASHLDLLDQAKRKCPNGPAMAGKIYTECVGWAPTQRGEDYDEFCKCYGSNYAKLYSKNPSENQLVEEAQMTVALEKCDVNSVNRRAQDRDVFVKRLKESNVYDRLFPGAKGDDTVENNPYVFPKLRENPGNQ